MNNVDAWTILIFKSKRIFHVKYTSYSVKGRHLYIKNKESSETDFEEAPNHFMICTERTK